MSKAFPIRLPRKDEIMWRCCSGWLPSAAHCPKCGMTGPDCCVSRRNPGAGRNMDPEITRLVPEVLRFNTEGLMQIRIAERLGISETTVNRIILGKR